MQSTDGVIEVGATVQVVGKGCRECLELSKNLRGCGPCDDLGSYRVPDQFPYDD